MWDVSGTSGAAPIWAAVMNFLHRTLPSRAPAAPAGVMQLPVRFTLGERDAPVEAARTEWFLQGTGQSRFGMSRKAWEVDASGALRPGAWAAKVGRGARITSPGNGTIVALDPDIPPGRQRLGLRAEGENLSWLLDGKVFAAGDSVQWLPWPGRHRVQIAGAGGEVLDEIRIEVRGAALRRAGVAVPDRH